MKEYMGLKQELLNFLRIANGEDYDSVYYFIGKMDFNQDDDVAIEAVADIVLMKSTKGKINSYCGKNSLQECIITLSNSHVVQTEKMLKNATARDSAEKEVKSRGFTYIPTSDIFISIASRAMQMPTQAQLDRVARELEHGTKNTFSQQFMSRLNEQLSNPVQEIGVGWMILYGVVILIVILSCFS